MSGAPAAGSSVLHYRILRAIGSGGMGVVYEAEDTKLGRRVALKFLPPELARDRPALERFQREARAASALNHPNICTVYAIEEWNGEHFIAMELLDGESLDQRIADRPLAWDVLLDTGIQVADALDAAHQRGIIHRDIKPANIFLTRDKRAKVLDFGVAKVTAAAHGDGETIGVAAAQHALTGPGVSVGTIAYMSPEQARGDELDARSDLFSLAAVLYEMSTGQRAFDGKTSAVVFQKILDGHPAAPRELNATLPPKLEDVVLKGLEKDRELRYQTAAELRGDLKRLKRDASSGTLAFAPASPGDFKASPKSSGAIFVAEARRRKGLTAVIAMLLLAMAVAAAYGIRSMLRRDQPSETALSAGERMSVTRLTTSGDVRGCGSISPDGKYVVYCDFANRLWVRQVATGSTVQIGASVGATTFSPDSNFVYLSTNTDEHPRGVLWAIPTLGGEPRRVLTNLKGAVGVAPDGQRIAFIRDYPGERETALMIADAFGGNERRLAIGSLQNSWFKGEGGVSWSADAKLLSTSQATIVGGYRVRPVVVDAVTGTVTLPGSATWTDVGRTAWLPDSRAILFAAREHIQGPYQFWIAPHSAGEPRRITSETRGFGSISVSVTADGSTIATIPDEAVSNLWSTNADATGPLEQWTSGIREDGNSGIAPKSNGGVYFSSMDGTDLGIWSVDSPGGRPRKLTRQYAEGPSIPADGRFVAFQAIHQDRYRIWRMQPDGAEPRVLSRGEDDIFPVVNPDGRWIYYAVPPGRIMRMSAEGGEGTPFGDQAGVPIDVSVDGRELLIGVQPSSSTTFVSHAILDAHSGAVKVRMTLPAGAMASRGRRDDLVAYTVSKDGVVNLWEQPVAGGPPRQLTKFTSGRIFNFAYTPDRKRLFLARGTRIGDVVLIRDFR
ncbi:MAG: serine/threonine-protein kinase [Acidobacteria bacterium]|nr:serine/threonine-protein kinase [Acidobacteriota bacterium]